MANKTTLTSEEFINIIKNAPIPFDDELPTPRCIRCNKTPDEIQEYIEAAAEEETSPSEFVRENEGTYNRRNGHFACTECYIEMGMPSSPTGYIAP